MNVTFSLDWRVAVALGTTAVVLYLVNKMDAAAVEKVSTTLADTFREFAVAQQSDQ